MERDRVERVSLIDWICVRTSHHGVKPADPSGPMQLHDDGRWSFCPAGLAPDADHVWYATGGVTRAALARFTWPAEDAVKPATAATRKSSPRPRPSRTRAPRSRRP